MGKNANQRVTVEFTRSIKSALSAMRVKVAEAKEAEAKFNTLVAKALASVGADVDNSGLCLNCGNVLARTEPPTPCAECAPKSKKPSAPAPA